jgi:hypothetical protein
VYAIIIIGCIGGLASIIICILRNWERFKHKHEFKSKIIGEKENQTERPTKRTMKKTQSASESYAHIDGSNIILVRLDEDFSLVLDYAK